MTVSYTYIRYFIFILTAYILRWFFFIIICLIVDSIFYNIFIIRCIIVYTIFIIICIICCIDRSIDIEFLAPWYSNKELGLSRGQAERYLMDLDPKLPENLTFIWTGPSVRSADISRVDIKRYQENGSN